MQCTQAQICRSRSSETTTLGNYCRGQHMHQTSPKLLQLQIYQVVSNFPLYLGILMIPTFELGQETHVLSNFIDPTLPSALTPAHHRVRDAQLPRVHTQIPGRLL